MNLTFSVYSRMSSSAGSKLGRRFQMVDPFSSEDPEAAVGAAPAVGGMTSTPKPNQRMLPLWPVHRQNRLCTTTSSCEPFGSATNVGPQPTMAAVSNLFLPPLLVHELTSLEPNVCWHHEKVADQAERVMQVTISNLGSTDDTCSFKVHS